MSHQSSNHPSDSIDADSARIKGINHRKRPYELWALISFPWSNLPRHRPEWMRLGKYRTPAERDIAKEAHSKYTFYVEFADKKPEKPDADSI